MSGIIGKRREPKTIAMDIETAGRWKELTEDQRDHLNEVFARNPQPGETPKSRTPLHPDSGKVIVIGTADVETETGTVWFEGAAADSFTHAGTRFVGCPTERDILAAWWAACVRAERIVVYSGKRFDVPYVTSRSLDYDDVEITKDLATKWYDRGPVVDLREELSIKGNVQPYGLSFQCNRFGVPSPKHDLSGKRVQEAYERGEITRIARYCFDDVVATARLWRRLGDRLLRLRVK